MNITLKGVPDELHQRLKAVAEETGRSLNKLILVTLESAFVPRKTSRAALVRRIRSRREQMEPILEDSTLREAIDGDRE